MKKVLYTTIAFGFFLMTTAGCSSSSSGAKSYKLGTFNVQVGGTNLSVTDQYGRTILPGYTNTIMFGSGTPSVKETFGSFAITETATWIKPGSLKVISSNNGQMIIEADTPLGNTSAQSYIIITPISSTMLGISITAPAGTTATGLPINRVMLNMACGSSDHFYGLGEQYNSFDQKGNIVGIWTQDHGFLQDVPIAANFQAALHPTYFPEPFMLTSKPAGILISSTAYSKFDLCASDQRQASIELWDNDMNIILISDKDPIHIIQDFTGIVGRQPLSRPWVIGPWISVEGGSLSLTTTADQLRVNSIPSSAIWYQDWVGGNADGAMYDLPYHWTPDYTLYPDMAAVNMTLNTMGFKALAYFNSFVDEALDQWTEATTGGYLITTGSAGQPYTFTGAHGSPESMVDLTDPAANTWVEGYMQSATTLGFSGWMADFGEYLPFDSYMQGGAAPMLHNEYPVLWAKLNYQAMSKALPNGDFAFFMRSGYLGSQPYQPVVWGGDQNTDFDPTFGLPTVVPAAINMGISGVPIFTHDIAGFSSVANPPSTQELYFRWTELGCFTPVMRTHNGLDYFTNWNWNSNAATIQMFKTYATLHVEMFPYIYTLMTDAHDNGTPIMQALWLKYYTDAKTATIDDEYLFGDNMLVAPVITQGAVTRTLYLPAGNWYPFFNGGPAVAGGASVTVNAPVDSIPVFVPAGSIIPMLTQAPDTLITGTTVITGTTLADVITAQTIRVYPGANGSFTVYDGSSFSLTSPATGLNPANGLALTDGSGQALQPCSSSDTGAVACGMISGTTFEVNGTGSGSSIFILHGTPANPATVYRIVVF